MTEKKGKRAVIISNIRSNSIEQAIFILKSPEAEGSSEVGSGIVAEAQEIINSYIKRVERAMPLRTRAGKRKRIITWLITTGCILAAAGIFLVLKVNGV